jgi:hypothetical protein
MKRLIKKSENSQYTGAKLITVEDDYLDEVPEDKVKDTHVTRVLEGVIDVFDIMDFPGANGEDRDWHFNGDQAYFGTYTEEEWYDFLDDIEQNGIKKKVFLKVFPNGDIKVIEGNHRIKAALHLNIRKVPIMIKYFGNSQKFVDYFDKP